MRAPAQDVQSSAKLIPISARSPFEYHEYARVRVDDGRLVCDGIQTDACGATTSVPYRNVAALLLGPGTSITCDAMELLASAGVVVGFTGGAATPLSQYTEPVFSSGASEYRPTERMQSWVSMWSDDAKRLAAARHLLLSRCRAIEKFWGSLDLVADTGARPDAFFRKRAAACRDATSYHTHAFRGRSVDSLLGEEGVHVRNLYQYLAGLGGVDFRLDRDDDSGVNKRLRVGNYIAYGMAASVLATLGISFAFPLLHGKKRRGALVFDIADVIKDAITTPLAFRADLDNVGDYRRACKQAIVEAAAIKYLINVADEICLPGRT